MENGGKCKVSERPSARIEVYVCVLVCAVILHPVTVKKTEVSYRFNQKGVLRFKGIYH